MVEQTLSNEFCFHSFAKTVSKMVASRHLKICRKSHWSPKVLLLRQYLYTKFGEDI